MFDEELPKPKTSEFPRNLVDMSVDELNEYIAELKEEVTRTETDRDNKQGSMSDADALFRS